MRSSFLLGLLGATALVACGDSSPSELTWSRVEGEWTLTALVVALDTNPSIKIDRVEVDEYQEQLVLLSDTTYAFSVSLPDFGPIVDTGVVHFDGDSISFVSQFGPDADYTASVRRDGPDLVFRLPVGEWVYDPLSATPQVYRVTRRYRRSDN